MSASVTFSAHILFAHGARDPEWARPMHRVRAAMLAQAPQARVELAFLEFMEPGLEDCARRLVAEGFRRITVVPLFIARGGHLKNDVPVLIAALRQAHPDCEFVVSEPVGEAESVVQAMAEFALHQ